MSFKRILGLFKSPKKDCVVEVNAHGIDDKNDTWSTTFICYEREVSSNIKHMEGLINYETKKFDEDAMLKNKNMKPFITKGNFHQIDVDQLPY